ncbi:hypothetical protein [Methylobacterium aquaticum]|jgi:hypothetical protein|uniref:Uncharacterized protein n=1 Tax=Methylobacterium aquaticum TaxID=270351 RepID=A0A0J6SGF3_9HYPH|nr:hypothetical protein [Methylobacterium aquaticum]KMO34310.1 hypothetical protein VP06_14665 [Methylobacterium aquaticum]
MTDPLDKAVFAAIKEMDRQYQEGYPGPYLYRGADDGKHNHRDVGIDGPADLTKVIFAALSTLTAGDLEAIKANPPGDEDRPREQAS